MNLFRMSGDPDPSLANKLLVPMVIKFMLIDSIAIMYNHLLQFTAAKDWGSLWLGIRLV